MFKVGDKVRLKMSYMTFPIGLTGTVTKIRPTERCGNTMIEVAFDVGTNTAAFDFRFERVSNSAFNISTATDQELANEYRRMQDERKPVYDELIRRGFDLFDKTTGAPFLKGVLFGTNIRITKTERRVDL